MHHFTDVPPMVVENLLSGVIFPAMFLSFLSGVLIGTGVTLLLVRVFRVTPIPPRLR